MSLTPDEIKGATESVVWIAKREGSIYGFWRSPPDIEQDPGAVAVYESDADVQAFISRPVGPPRRVTPLQMRRALRALGHLAAVNAYVAQQSADVQEAWEFSDFIPFNDPLVVAAAAALGVDRATLFDKAEEF